MQYELEPGNFVINPSQKDWGTGQIQSIIKIRQQLILKM